MCPRALSRSQFPAMITDWRQKWNGGTSTNAGRPKPFLFVELAPYTEGAGEPFDTSVAKHVLHHRRTDSTRGVTY
jgi:hypothetical protein